MTARDQEAQNSSTSHVAESFQKPSKLIAGIISQGTFDKTCMILAEVIGTGMLLFFGCAGAIFWNGPPGISTPINFGLTVMMIIQSFGHISYALLNPAVSICAVVNKIISVKASGKEKNLVKLNLKDSYFRWRF
jgi:Major intrinsic protein